MNLLSKLPLDEDDVALIFEDVYNGRSVIPPHVVPSKPVLVRWDLRRPLTAENCVVMEHKEAERHTKECAGDAEAGRTLRNPEEVWGKEAAEIVLRRAKEISRNREWMFES